MENKTTDHPTPESIKYLPQEVVLLPQLRVLGFQVREAVHHAPPVQKRLPLSDLPLPQPLAPHDGKRICIKTFGLNPYGRAERESQMDGARSLADR